MKKIKFFAVLLAIAIVILNSSFTYKNSFTSYWCFGVISKTSYWPGTWRYTLMAPDCYYVQNWGCEVDLTECTVCIDLGQANVIYDDGCLLTVEISWQDVFVEQEGEFIYEIY